MRVKIMLKKIVPYAFIISIFCSNAAFCMEPQQEVESAFIAKQGNKIITEVGNPIKRRAPFSTFKTVLAAIGFDAGILESKDSPKWSFKKEYMVNIPWYNIEENKYGWVGDHTPETFMANSVLWFSHQITEKLGKEKFQGYVSKLNYGNKDVSGTPGKDDSLLKSWLGTSLEISPREQVEFLEKLLTHTLPLSEDAQVKTREIMDRKETWNEWKLYGKTGGGNFNNGWFIGWIEKDGTQPIVFAQYLDKNDPDLNLEGLPVHPTVGLTAKEVAKRHLKNVWQEASK